MWLLYCHQTTGDYNEILKNTYVIKTFFYYVYIFIIIVWSEIFYRLQYIGVRWIWIFKALKDSPKDSRIIIITTNWFIIALKVHSHAVAKYNFCTNEIGILAQLQVPWQIEKYFKKFSKFVKTRCVNFSTCWLIYQFVDNLLTSWQFVWTLIIEKVHENNYSTFKMWNSRQFYQLIDKFINKLINSSISW